MQPKNMLRKNLPKALTAVLSPSRSANRAPPGSSSRNGRSHRRRRSECNSHVWSTYPPTFFFFFFAIGVGTRPGREWVCSLTLTLKLQDISKGPRTHTFPFPIFFFPLVAHPPPPPRGRGDSKRSTPQNEKAEKLVGEGSEEASESGRPVWSAVHVVQVHIGSNLQRGGFRPCVSGLLAKHLGGWGSRLGAWNPICTAQSIFFFFFGVLGLSHPWLYDADNRVTNKIGKGYCACFQCETTKGNEEGTGNRARGPQLLFFLYSKSKLKQDRSQLQEGSHKPKLDMQNSQSLLLFFFLTKNAWSFWAKRLDEENKIGKRVERQMAKLESIHLGNGKNGCRARPATSTIHPAFQVRCDHCCPVQ